MSEDLQFGHHPDADQIGAFVEHALPAHEQEQMLSHLAVCTECRAVVALSLPSVEEPAIVVSADERRPWWLGWTLAWPAATAFAALAIVAVYLYRAPVSSAPPQIAGNNPSVSQNPIGQLEAPTATVPARDAQAQTTANNRAAAAAEKERLPEQKPYATFSAENFEALPMRGRNADSVSEFSQPSAGIAAENQKKSAGRDAASSANVISGGGKGFGAGAVANPSGAVINGLQRAAPARRAELAVPAAPPKTMAAAMASPAPSNETVMVTASAPVLETESAEVAATLDESQFAQLKRALPSHLPVLSMAGQARRIVAIDAHNGVFLSKDDGKHWKAVRAQWAGRAVRAEVVEFPAKISVAFKKEKSAALGGMYADKTVSQEKVSGALNAPSQTETNPTGTNPTGSSVSGKVMDGTGAVIAGASVAVTDAATHTARSVRTDSNGGYLVDRLTPGTYQVEAQARGFETQELAAVAVAAGRPAVANLKLNVGAATQTVTVETGASGVSVDAKTKAKSESSKEPAALFEITTENGERWTSIDGAAWTRMDSTPQK